MKKTSLLVIAIIILAALFPLISEAQTDDNLNLRPIIGILSQPTDGPLTAYGNAYIAASYVKFVEAAGARVVPIFWNSSTSQLEQLLASINGVLFPGGGSNFTGLYWQTVTTIWNYILKSTDSGNYYPLYGICMGFQEVSVLASGNLSLLTQFNSENITLPLTFTPAAANSAFLGSMSPWLQRVITTQNVTMNDHSWGVSPASFQNDKNLPNFYTVTSTSVDRDGLVFISTMEAKKYPILGTQWHPEKNVFEWTTAEPINHSPDAVAVTQFAMDFFVNRTRLNFNKFSTPQEEAAALIYNWAPIYTGLFDTDFTQTYIWNVAV